MKLPHLKQNSPPYHLYTFLKQNYSGGELLLALSGGGDSLALLHSLLLLKDPLHLKIVLLHVNHGLRTESEEEEKEIRALSEKLALPLEVKKLSFGDKKNLEKKARDERYAFFSSVYKRREAEAILLGHHGDDQAETVLKRLLEGSPLFRLKGIESISHWEGIPLWRPFLTLRKREIESFLLEIGVLPFEDSTNFSQDNLRGKFRTVILPFLSSHFGKEVVPPLLNFQKEMVEYTSLLDELTSSYFSNEQSLEIPKIHPTLQKHLVRRFLEFHRLRLSTPHLDSLINSLELPGTRAFPLEKKSLHLSNYKIYF